MITDDIIAVRFLSKPYGRIQNLREGSPLIKPWLIKNEIRFRETKSHVLFELPNKYMVLQSISQQLIDSLRPIRDIFVHEMLKLDSYFSHHMKRFGVRLTQSEVLLVYELTETKFSFIKFEKMR